MQKVVQKRTNLQLLAMAEVCKKPPGTKKPRIDLGFSSGAKRIRTADPLHAMQVLYQLSYGPITYNNIIFRVIRI